MAEIEYIGKCLVVETETGNIDKMGKRILVIGDLHIGYEESLNNAGVFVSRKMYEEMTSELDKVFRKTLEYFGDGESKRGIDEVVLLGDVKHVFGGIMRQEWKEVSDLIDYLRRKMEESRRGKGNEEGKVIIVKGNHDSIIEPIARKKGVDVKDYYIVGEVCFMHGDNGEMAEIYEKSIEYWVMGHGHPAVKLSDGVKVEKYKCFLVGEFKGKEVIIVPSFSEYSQGSDPRENDLGLAWCFNLKNFEVKIVGEKLEVLSFGKLNKIK